MSGSGGRDGGEDRDESGPGFVVIDKRGREQPEPAAEAAAPDAGSPAGEASEDAPPRPGSLPRVDFTTLAISLGTSAMMHLGMVADPQTGQPAEKNPELARQTIDTLEMLQEKTRGNLDPDEERLLQNLLTDLRMRFVEAQR